MCSVWFGGLPSQRFKLVDEVGACARIEILNLPSQATELWDLYLGWSEFRER
jgi:hypothetical protein